MNAKTIGSAIGLLCACLSAQGQLVWTTNNNNEIRIAGGYIGPDGNLVIPETITGLPVTEINRNAFWSHQTLTNLVVAGSVRTLADGAFAYCDNLENVTLGSGLTNIDYMAFFANGRLTNISVAAENPAFESSAGVLFEKEQATLVLHPPGKAGNYTVPSTVTRLWRGAFQGCKFVNAVTLPDGVVEIPNDTFYECWNLLSVTLGQNLKKIGYLAFYDCNRLTDVTLPQSLTNIQQAFVNCTQMTNISLGTNLTHIAGAFRNCSGLTNFVVPEKVTDLGDMTFSGCANLQTVTLPAGLERIGRATFSQCARLSNMPLPEGLEIIDHYAFEYCERLAYHTLPSTVTFIGESIFRNCLAITSFDIPDQITYLSAGMFNHCDNLASVNIGKGVFGIDQLPFANCASLVSVSVDPQNIDYSSAGGVLFNKNKARLVYFPQGVGGTYTVPTSVTKIEDWAFSQSTLSTVTLPASVNRIDNGAFSSCDNLSALWFQGNAPTIEWGALNFANGATLYYYPGASGWEALIQEGKFQDRPVFLWNPSLQNVRVENNHLTFEITGSSNMTVVVEHKPDPGPGTWTAIQSKTLTNGVATVQDTNTVDNPSSFYRLTTP